jgi:hypothetical protein
MSPSLAARDIASKFVMKHRSTFGEVDEKKIDAAVNKVARVLKGLQVAERRAQRASDTSKAERTA